MMLGSSVVSPVSYEELTFAANLISPTFLSFEVYLVTTGLQALSEDYPASADDGGRTQMAGVQAQ